jgi:hypothetical protein
MNVDKYKKLENKKKQSLLIFFTFLWIYFLNISECFSNISKWKFYYIATYKNTFKAI